ncbi:MAG TPA: SDR family NAD(P)-dependent oxidoreductase [Candidatus Acidoferrales bacterium]|nr:SDR family NAD(P)-dependent oxidoreductase [Candidatus Acidoferrales bacterium]
MLLKDQRAIVTGGGRGIGRAIALRFAREGAAVLVAARTAAEVDAVAGEIRAAGGRAASICADVSLPAGCETIYRAAVEHFGGVDLLVNNAGMLGPVAPVEGISPEEWDAVLAANLKSAFLMARLVLPGMLERRQGVILNISSVAAKMAFGLNSAYAASKAGLVALTRTLAAETGTRGVRVNALCPGPVPETQMSREIGEGLSRAFGVPPSEILEGAKKGILQGRAQTAEEIAAAALFLCSEQASAITGQALNVDGGMAFF